MKKLRLILVSLLLTTQALAADLKLSWDRVTEDTKGEPLPPDIEIEYKIYSMIDGVDGEFKYRLSSDQTYMVVTLRSPACFSVYVTAVRSDNGLESDPSNIEYLCWQGDTPDEPDVPVEQFPPASTTLEMSIDG